MTPALRAFPLVALALAIGCASGQATGPRRFAVLGPPLPRNDARFAFASEAPRLFHTRTGAFTRPLVIEEGVVLANGRRSVRRLPLRTDGFRGRRLLIVSDGERRVQFQYDAPFEGLPVEAGDRIRLKALTLSEADRLAFGFALWGEEDGLRAIGIRGSSPSSIPIELLEVGGWRIALGEVLTESDYCGGVIRERMVIVTAPDGRPAHVHPGFRYELVVGGERWSVDVGAARSIHQTFAEARSERDFSVLIRRMDIVAEEPEVDRRLAGGI